MSSFKTEINTYLMCRGMYEKSDKTSLKYCKECKSVWEEFWDKLEGTKKSTKYPDMPTYGLKRITCYGCR